jgi:hypothetical protein
MRPVFRWLLSFCVLAAPATSDARAFEDVGYFCPTCNDENAAREKALSAVPRPRCASEPSEDLHQVSVCRAPERRAFIVNQKSRAVYAFLVAWDPQSRDYLIQQEIELDQAEDTAYQKLIDFRLHWESVLLGHHGAAMGTPPPADNPEIHTDDACGGGTTVLDVALFSNSLGLAENQVRQIVRQAAEGFEAHQPRVRSGGIGVSAHDVHAEADLESSMRNQLQRVLLASSSNEGGDPGDHASFSVELLGVNTLGQASARVEFEPENSVALGRSLEDVLSGQVNVEDKECVREKLATLAERDGEGEWRARGGQAPLKPSDLRGPAAPGSGPTCWIDFHQGARVLHTFRVDCARLE